MKIPKKEKEDSGILYVSGVTNENIEWIRTESKKLGYKASEYLNIVINNLKKKK